MSNLNMGSKNSPRRTRKPIKTELAGFVIPKETNTIRLATIQPNHASDNRSNSLDNYARH